MSVIPLTDAGQLLSAEWVEGMRDAHKIRRRVRTVCIWR